MRFCACRDNRIYEAGVFPLNHREMIAGEPFFDMENFKFSFIRTISFVIEDNGVSLCYNVLN